MISDLFDSLCEAFKAFGCPAELFLGAQYRFQHTAPLRVVIYQDSSSPIDTFAPPNPSVVVPQMLRQAVNPRAVATRVCGFTAELWATAPRQRNPADQSRADTAYLDALINQLYAALQQISSGIYEVAGGRHAIGNGAATSAGLGYQMLCSCGVPIISVAWPAEQLSKCSETWRYGQAEADVSIVKKPGDTESPKFHVPTPE